MKSNRSIATALLVVCLMVAPSYAQSVKKVGRLRVIDANGQVVGNVVGIGDTGLVLTNRRAVPQELPN